MADAPPPKAAYSRGNKLRLCAPAHTGLPMNASAVVAACRFTAEGWRYDVTLTGGGSSGSASATASLDDQNDACLDAMLKFFA